MRHIVWDWNGTLFDDLHIVVESVNASLARFGEGPIDAAEYRDHYRRPVPEFYRSLLGRDISHEMWETIDRVFHETYHASLGEAGLTADAGDAVAAIEAARGTQSILSMWWHDQLVPAVRSTGLEGRMLLVDGHRGVAGETKVQHLIHHLEVLGRDHPGLAPVVVIGDITDDAESAAAAGVECVLYDSGSQPPAVLAGTGFPVADSLLAAIGAAGIPVPA